MRRWTPLWTHRAARKTSRDRPTERRSTSFWPHCTVGKPSSADRRPHRAVCESDEDSSNYGLRNASSLPMGRRPNAARVISGDARKGKRHALARHCSHSRRDFCMTISAAKKIENIECTTEHCGRAGYVAAANVNKGSPFLNNCC